MQQIYRRTPMPKCNFNIVVKQLYWNRTSVWCSTANLLHIFRIPFLKNTSRRLLLHYLLDTQSKSINRHLPSIFFDWFTFSGNLHRYETRWSANNHLNIPTFRAQKYGHCSIRASAIHWWNFTQDMLKINK